MTFRFARNQALRVTLPGRNADLHMACLKGKGKFLLRTIHQVQVGGLVHVVSNFDEA